MLVRPQERRVFVTATRASGFTLIELMIAVAIAATLLLLAAPNFATWNADAQIRAAAESIVSGMRYAQAEAVRRNEPIEFVLAPTTGTGGWTVRRQNTDQLQVGVFAEGAVLAAFTTAPVATVTTTFNSLGGVNPTNLDTTLPIRVVDVTFSASITNARNLTVLVGGGRTGIKVCDPAVSDTTSPRFCTT